ncbi:MAG: hypothetical protein KC978_25365, partial [Candidatus Omnitrophica bacterium]|nr:hypothetical protein [Candidatus Omnitrophota bacterium]
MIRILRFVSRHPWLFVALHLPLLAVAGYFMLQVKVDNNIRIWLDSSDPALRDYDALLDRFGHDVLVSVVFFGDDLFTQDFLQSLKQLGQELKDKPDWFEGAFSAGDVYSAWEKIHKERNPDDTEEEYSRKFKKYLTDSELYTGLVTSASGNCVALNFTLT